MIWNLLDCARASVLNIAVTRKSLFLAALLLGSALALLPLLAAQKKSDSKKKTPTVAQARQAHTSAMKKLADAQKALKVAEQKVVTTRTQVTKKHLSDSGLNKVRSALLIAAAEYKTAKSALQRVIRERTDYVEAKSAAKDASAELRALNSMKKMTAERKKAKRSELSAIVRQPIQIERESLAGNERLGALERELKLATAAEQATRAKLGRLTMNDASLKNAISAFGRAKDTVAAAEKGLSQARQQVASATRVVAEQKRQQQSQNKNSTKKKNTRKKKGGKKSGKKK